MKKFYLSLLIYFISLNMNALEVPKEVIKRPQVLPPGLIELSSLLKIASFSDISINAGLIFGLTDNFQGSIVYDGLEFNQLRLKKVVHLLAKYRIITSNHIKSSFEFDLPFHIRDGEILREFTVGFPTVLHNEIIAVGFLSELITWHMREYMGLDVNLPFFVGAQVTDSLFLKLNSTVGQMKITNELNQIKFEPPVWIWQKPSVDLNVIYNVKPSFDLIGQLGFNNLLNIKNSFWLALGLAVRI